MGGLRHLAPSVDAGLAALDAEAMAAEGSLFSALPASQQDRLLSGVERGDVQTTWPIPPQEFFATLARLTAEGYYGDPSNGGNRGAVSWHMIGYDPRLPDQHTDPRLPDGRIHARSEEMQ